MNIKVICLNMWFGGKLFSNIEPFIKQEQADILGLQEVYNSEIQPLEERWHAIGNLAQILGYPYYAFAPAFKWNNRPAQNGNAILSKYPIVYAKSFFYDEPYNGNYQEIVGDYRITPRNLQHAEIQINDQNLHFFNTQGIWGFDGNDSDRRLNMGKIIAEHVAGKTPALLMGDFNVQEGTKTAGLIEAHMKNIFKGELKTSFNMQHKKDGGFATAVVDMIFASPDVTVKNKKVATENVSDHVALVAEIEI